MSTRIDVHEAGGMVFAACRGGNTCSIVISNETDGGEVVSGHENSRMDFDPGTSMCGKPIDHFVCGDFTAEDLIEIGMGFVLTGMNWTPFDLEKRRILKAALIKRISDHL